MRALKKQLNSDTPAIGIGSGERTDPTDASSGTGESAQAPETGRATPLANKVRDWVEAMEVLVRHIEPVLPERRAQGFERLGLNAAMEWFDTEAPSGFDVIGGVLLRVRKTRRHGWLIAQAFVRIEHASLDADAQDRFQLVVDEKGRVHGRKFFVRRIDADLEHAFGGHNLLFVT
jgi:hypothetical protein